MIGEICADIRNYFTKEEDKHFGVFTITNGAIVAPSIDLPTDYIRIVGSRLNDGVHKLSDNDLVDETFDGAVWVMSPPKDFLSLVDEIKNWNDKNGGYDSVANSPFSSESFGGYAYSKSTSGDGNSSSVSWKNAYGKRLNIYRRFRV